jgi:subtilisin-like proprotein convertase family protein
LTSTSEGQWELRIARKVDHGGIRMERWNMGLFMESKKEGLGHVCNMQRLLQQERSPRALVYSCCTTDV